MLLLERVASCVEAHRWLIEREQSAFAIVEQQHAIRVGAQGRQVGRHERRDAVQSHRERRAKSKQRQTCRFR